MTYTIRAISIRDFKRIRTAEIPVGNVLTIIGGNNAQGKSSAIDAFVSLVAGAKSLPGVPIRRGADRAEIAAVIDGPNGRLILKRVITPGGTTLTLENEDGMGAKAPQQRVDELFSVIGMDPLAFTRLKPKEQVETLKGVFGLDFSEIDRRREALYQERTGQNAIVRDLEGKYRQIQPEPAGTPDEEVDVTALSEQLRQANAANQRNAIQRADARAALNRVEEQAAWLGRDDAEIEELERQLAARRERNADYRKKLAESSKLADALQHEAENTLDQSTAELEAAIAAASETNQHVRQKARRLEERERWESAKQRSADLTAMIDECDREKAALVAEVKLPVPGLEFGEAGLILNGLPFEQASSAEQLRVSIPVAFAQNRAVKFAIIRDGSLLDEDSLALVAELTEQAGAQTIIERVGGEGDVVFVDGELS